MPYFAVILARVDGEWTASEIDLDDAQDIEDVADRMREVVESDLGQRGEVAGPSLLLVEENDEWFAIARVDGPESEPQVFISDMRALESSDMAAVLFEQDMPENLGDDEPIADDDSEQSATPPAEPGGATGVLADLGLPADDLLALCAEEGMLPIDVVSAVCERLGCPDEIEVLR